MKLEDFPAVYSHNNENTYLSYLPVTRETWYTKGYFLLQGEIENLIKAAYEAGVLAEERYRDGEMFLTPEDYLTQFGFKRD